MEEKESWRGGNSFFDLADELQSFSGSQEMGILKEERGNGAQILDSIEPRF
ncbi:MAG: hypothetical protein ACYC9S_09245 [Leptospirales bacterium]